VTSVLAQYLGAAVMAPMGHGLINFTIYGVIQGTKTHWYMILLAGIPCAILYFFVFRFLILKFDFATPGRGAEAEIKLSSRKDVEIKYDGEKKKETNNDDTALRTQALALIDAHGSRSNIVDVDACITRLRITVKDKSLVQPEIIKGKLQAMGFVESDMQMQSIYGGHANVLKNEILEIFEEEDKQ
jgi:PTS system maltose and glucose-specific IIC component